MVVVDQPRTVNDDHRNTDDVMVVVVVAVLRRRISDVHVVAVVVVVVAVVVVVDIDNLDDVGTCDLPVEVVPPSGAPERRSVRLVVAWSATTDLSKLGEERSRVHVVFHVVRGASLWVEGTAIRVSGDTGIAEIPVAPTPKHEMTEVMMGDIAVPEEPQGSERLEILGEM